LREQLRRLRDIRRDPSRLILAEQLGCGSSPRLILEIDIGKLLTVVVADNKAGGSRGSIFSVKTEIKFTWRPIPIRHTLAGGDGGVMSKFERLLEAGSTELPDCRCAAEMNLMAIVPVAGGDTEIRIFRCPDCSHELRLTAWRSC
jgi:hypothetical protein